MIFLEMSRDMTHGGGTWAFSNCVWAPTEKKKGGRWPFWEKVLSLREGDVVLHLRGIQPDAYFVGYSRSSGNGSITNKRPPDPGDWSYSKSFYRADLDNFTSFHEPISLTAIFEARRDELETNFDLNKARKGSKLNIFYVRQAGRLQCLNGAYLSEVDDDLFEALFGLASKTSIQEPIDPISVQTGSQLVMVRARLGQTDFSRKIKTLYGSKCCFPGCEISDPRFLIGAHIARWSDNVALRGHLGNGLCLCLFHDKAFELGLFTLNERYEIFVNPKEAAQKSSVLDSLIKMHGHQISLAQISPLDDALLEHWVRVDITP